MCYGSCDTFPLVNGMDQALASSPAMVKFWSDVKNNVKARNDALLFLKVAMVFLTIMGLFFFITSIMMFPKMKHLSSKIITWLPSVACLGVVIALYRQCNQYEIQFGQLYRKELEELPAFDIYNKNESIKAEVAEVLMYLPPAS